MSGERIAKVEAETALLREALTQISSQYIENRGDMTDAEALAAIKAIADAALKLNKFFTGVSCE